MDLYTVAIVILVLWLLGAFVYPVGPFIHTLLLIMIVVILIRVISDRNV